MHKLSLSILTLFFASSALEANPSPQIQTTKELCETGHLIKGHEEEMIRECSKMGSDVPCSAPHCLTCYNSKGYIIKGTNIVVSYSWQCHGHWYEGGCGCYPQGGRTLSDICNKKLPSKCHGKCSGQTGDYDFCP